METLSTLAQIQWAGAVIAAVITGCFTVIIFFLNWRSQRSLEVLKRKVEQEMQQIKTRDLVMMNQLSSFNALTAKHEHELYLEAYDALHQAQTILSYAKGLNDPKDALEEIMPPLEVDSERLKTLEEAQRNLMRLEKTKRLRPFMPQVIYDRIDRYWEMAWKIFEAKKYPDAYPNGPEFTQAELKAELNAIVQLIRARVGVE